MPYFELQTRKSNSFYLAPEILDYKGKKIVHIHVPPSSEVHTFKKVIYDRVDDADVKVTATAQIAQMYIRKQRIFTEKKVYPYVRDEHLRFDLLPRIRRLATNRYTDHPWKVMSDAELLQSAGLIGEDLEAGIKGYNLAAVMLLGRDEIIKSVSPAYRTDALLRKVNTDRYDDRLIVATNLIDSYDLLMGFAAKHLWDKFYLEGDTRVSLSRYSFDAQIGREEIKAQGKAQNKAQLKHADDCALIEAVIMEYVKEHPEATQLEIAEAVGKSRRMIQNMITALKNKGLLEREGARKNGRWIVKKIGTDYSFDVQIGREENKAQDKAQLKRNDDCALIETAIMEYVKEHPEATQLEIADALGKSRRTVQEAIAGLKNKSLLEREGAKRMAVGSWPSEAVLGLGLHFH